MTDIHPTAIVSPGAALGEGVTIGPYAVIEDHTEIGDGCFIESHCVVRRYTRMGTRNHVYPHTIVGGDSQDLKFKGEETWLIIGNNNTLREYSTTHRGTAEGNGKTVIGDNNLLMAYTHVAHDCILGSGIIMSNLASLAGHVVVDDYAIIGGMSGVHQFVRIGSHSFVGGMSGVAQDVPPWMLVVGGRATVHAPNIVGMRRAKLPRETVAAVKGAYTFLYHSGLMRDEALGKIIEQYGSIPEAAAFAAFVRASVRGVCPAEKTQKAEN